MAAISKSEYRNPKQGSNDEMEEMTKRLSRIFRLVIVSSFVLRISGFPPPPWSSPPSVLSASSAVKPSVAAALLGASAINSLLPRAQLPAEPDLRKAPIAQDC